MKRVLTVGITYSGDPIDGVEIDNLGLCRPAISRKRAAFPLYEYDTIIINPESYSHFLFGAATKLSGSKSELSDLKRKNNDYDLDTAFDFTERSRELAGAFKAGAAVVWCLAEPRRMNFFGYRETHLGYVNSQIADLIKHADLIVRRED